MSNERPDTIVRVASESDADAIAELMIQLGYEIAAAMMAEKLRLFEQSQDDQVFVAIGEQRLIGCLSAHTHELFHSRGRLGMITSLVVHGEARRSGVGTALLEAAQRFFRAAGCVRVEVTSAEHRVGAHAFYLANGFVEDERRFIKKAASAPVR